LERLGETMELPRTAVTGDAHIELMGNREALVDGCKGVLQYDEGCIRLNTGRTVVCFSGSDLSITALQMEQAVITGTILAVSFCN